MLLAALILLVTAGIYVRPSLPFFPDNLVGGARYYEQVAEDPFGGNYWANYRILMPLIAHLLGLGGPGLPYLGLVLIYATICLLFADSLVRTGDHLWALATTAAVALTMPVLYGLYDLWTLDIGRVLFVGLMVVFRRIPWLFWSLFTLSLFNHEGNAFMLPFFVLLQWVERRSTAQFLVYTAAGIAIATALYVPFNLEMGERVATAGATNLSAEGRIGPVIAGPLFYMRRGFWSLYDSVFSVFKLFWLVMLAGMFVAWRGGERMRALLILSAPASAMTMFVFGAETFRYLMVAFPGLLFAIDVLGERFGRRETAQVMLHLVLLNLFVPQQLVWDNQIGKMQNIFHMLMFWLF